MSYPKEAKNFLTEYDSLGFERNSYYLRAKMIFYQYKIEEYPDSAKFYLTSYVNQTPSYALNYPSCIITSSKLSDMEMASQLMSMYEQDCELANDFPFLFYYCRYLVREGTGDTIGALSDLKQNSTLINKTYTYNLDKELQTISIRYRAKLTRMRTSIIILSLVATLIFVILLLYLIIKEKKYKYDSIKNEYNSVKREYNHLNSLFQSEEGNFAGGLEAMEIRIHDMAAKFNGGKNPSTTGAALVLSKISGPDDFLSYISYLLAVYCRNTYLTLHEKGLDLQEIGICALLLIGVRVGELQDITGKKGVYNITRDIRSKLGIKGESYNLGHYLETIVYESKGN